MCAGGQPRSDCGSVRQPWATWSGYLGYQVYRYYGTPLASNNPSAAARFSRVRPEGDVQYKPRRCRVQVRAMRSTSGADAEYKLRNPRPALKFAPAAGRYFSIWRRRPFRTLPRPSFLLIHMHLQRACVRHEYPRNTDSRCRRNPTRRGSRSHLSRATLFEL